MARPRKPAEGRRLRHGLKTGEVLLVGGVYVFSNRKGVGLAVWCPYCKDHHHHGWDEAARSNEVSHRLAHCQRDDSPLRDRGYFIGMDPGQMEHNRAELGRFRVLQRKERRP